MTRGKPTLWTEGWMAQPLFSRPLDERMRYPKGRKPVHAKSSDDGERYFFLPHTLLRDKPISPSGDPVRQLLLQREMLLRYQPRTPRNVRHGIPGVPSPSHEGARGQVLTGERKWTSCGTKGWMTRKWMLTFSHLLFAPPTGWQKPWQSFLPWLSMSYVFGKGGLLGWGGGVLVKEWSGRRLQLRGCPPSLNNTS